MQDKATLVRRPMGFYHVRLGLKWTVAVWGYRENDGSPIWRLFETPVPFEDSDFDEIGDEVLPHDYDTTITTLLAAAQKEIESVKRINLLLVRLGIVIGTLLIVIQIFRK